MIHFDNQGHFSHFPFCFVQWLKKERKKSLVANILQLDSSVAKQTKLPLHLGGTAINKKKCSLSLLKDAIC